MRDSLYTEVRKAETLDDLTYIRCSFISPEWNFSHRLDLRALQISEEFELLKKILSKQH